MRNCLFCDSGTEFNTKEHIIPESLGNDDLILEKEICDKCQNYLSQIEHYVLSKTPLGFWRTLLTIKTKKGKLPAVDFTKNNTHGMLPDFHEHHDNFGFIAHDNFTTELNLDLAKINLDSEQTGQLKYVITPKVIHEIGRFIGKIGIELVCQDNPTTAREDQFAEIRKYIREGSLKEIWPIFHETNGNINDLFNYELKENNIEEIITCYSYSLFKIGGYIVFKFVLGTDNWFICLNQKFPHPSICQHMGNKVNAVWYSSKQWKKQ